MVIDAVERFAQRTADACINLWSSEETQKRAADWPPGYDQLVAEQIEKQMIVKKTAS